VSKKAKARHVPNAQMREGARTEFITDPQRRSVRWWHERVDREYRTIPWRSFQAWATKDDWLALREKFWRDVETYTITKLKRRAQSDRFRQYQQIMEDIEPLMEYTRPMRGPDGQVIRHPEGHEWAGLPVMPLAMGKMHEHVRSVLALIDAASKLRGDSVQDLEALERHRSAAALEGEDAPAERPRILIDDGNPEGVAARLNPEQLRQMARSLLTAENPALGAHLLDLPEED
jgi:hypothetical protein